MDTPVHVLAVIPARGGSKGIPHKNLRPLDGIPLVVHSIRAAQKARYPTRIVVSTDDPAIAAVAQEAGAEVIERPPELSGDTASSESALLHALDSLEAREGYVPDLLVFLQCTSPLTQPEDIDGTVEALLQEDADSALAVTPFHYFLWRFDEKGQAVGVNHDPRIRLPRQQQPPQFLETGAVYVMRVAGFRRIRHRFFGRIALYVMPPERVHEIDEPIDLAIAEAMLRFRPAQQSQPPIGPFCGPHGATTSPDGETTRKGADTMPQTIQIGHRRVGPGQPVYIIAEIGINHNGDLSIAKQLIDAAVLAGCDAVKFQKRTPEKCVPPEQRNVMRETPWGLMTYLDYRYKVEFGPEEYAEIDRYCRERGITWFASVWDEDAVDFMEAFDPVCYKIPSAALTDHALLRKVQATGRPVILSTGMSTMEEIHAAVDLLGTDNLILMHTTSTYPCKPEELNLRMIHTLQATFDCPIGYSGHEVGLQTTYAAVALGACAVERHITLDRAMWGSDQAASVEPWGLMRLVRDIRVIEKALGDGVKRVYESELPARAKLRRVQDRIPVPTNGQRQTHLAAD